MLNDKRILLIEDDEDLRMIFFSQLKDLNASVLVANSGNEAIKLLGLNLPIDIIVSDYSMPDGDGVSVLKYVAQKNLEIPFVFYTNNINPSIPEKYPRFLGIIHKLDFDLLVEVIKQNT